MGQLEKYFDTAFGAPEGIKKLRELILTLAMQGKLNRKNSNSKILEKHSSLRAGNRKTVKEDIIKPNGVPNNKDSNEFPYELPMGWKWVQLGEFTNYNGRKNINGSEISPETWVLDLEDIEKSTSKLLCKIPYKDRQSKSTKSTFKQGDVLYGKLRPYLDKVIVADSDGVCTTEIVPIVPNKEIDSYFLRWLLKRPAFLGYVNSLMYGIKMPRLGTEDAIKSLHPIPPYYEQKEIVIKIEELMSHCDELEKLRGERDQKRMELHTAAIRKMLDAPDQETFDDAWQFITRHFDDLYTVRENVAELRKAILQLAVMGKLVKQGKENATKLIHQIMAIRDHLAEENGLRTFANDLVEKDEEFLGKPTGWEYCRLGNLARFIDYRGKTPQKVKVGIPLITAKNVRVGMINREPYEYITQKEYINWMTRGFPKIGDLLFTTEAPLGNIAIIDIHEQFALAQRVICIQLHKPELAEYLKYLIMSVPFQTKLLQAATGMTAKGIKASKLKELPIPIPPLSEQKLIVDRINNLMSLCDALEKHIDDVRKKQGEVLGAVMGEVG